MNRGRKRTRSHRDYLKSIAGRAVAEAIKAGILPKQSNCTCVDCGKPAQQYDHRDYRKPLDVDPVCRSCNIRRGPGLPEITDIDELQHKTDFKIQSGDSTGYKWNSVEGGEGYSPLECRCVIEVPNNDDGAFLTNSGWRLSMWNTENSSVGGFVRSLYFKSRDSLACGYLFDDVI